MYFDLQVGHYGGEFWISERDLKFCLLWTLNDRRPGRTQNFAHLATP